MEIKVRVQNDKTVSYIRSLPSTINQNLFEALREVSRKLTRYVKTNYLRTKGENSIGRDTGEIFNSTLPLRVKQIDRDTIVGGTQIGSSVKSNKYVHVHVSPRPKSTVIFPKKADGRLAIPLAPARIGGGRLKPLDLPNAYFRGNLLVSSFLTGKFVPYFVMKRFVTVRSRVHTKKIANEFRPVITKTIDNYMRKGLK